MVVFHIALSSANLTLLWRCSIGYYVVDPLLLLSSVISKLYYLRRRTV